MSDWLEEEQEDEVIAPAEAKEPKPEAEPKDAPAPEPEAKEPEDAPTDDASDDDSPVSRGQLAALISEREKRQKIEREAEEARKERERLQAELESLRREQQSRTQKKAPDPMLDPEGYASFQQESFRDALRRERVNTSKVFAESVYGPDTVAQALKAFDEACRRDPSVSAMSYSIIDEPHPVDRVVKWHKQQSLLQEVGEDPEAYRERIRQEERERLMAEMKGHEGAAKVSPPPSLARGGQGGTTEPAPSEEEFFASVFKR